MRFLPRSSSSQRAATSSRSLRTGFLCVVKKRFLASCWVMVLPPREKRHFFRSSSNDFWTASQSTPSCPKNFWSSDESTACTRWRDTRESGTHDCTWRTVRPLDRASSSRWRITRVFPGFVRTSARTSDREGRPAQKYRGRATARPRRMMRARFTIDRPSSYHGARARLQEVHPLDFTLNEEQKL